ncbi:MAG TPA: hypothetical protein VFU15_16275 [Bacteroidia bacterium]|nr:hypothetical protein [Bacteroidia bacterium]
MSRNWEYATIEWLWDSGNFRVNLPGNRERNSPGSYSELVALLNEMGGEGWDVASCTSGGNWLFWTLKREK